MRPKHLTFDQIDVRDGLGERPNGAFVQGVPLIDPRTGNAVVIDPAELSQRVIDKIEQKADLDLVPPPQIRYDLGQVSRLDGDRLMLMDRSKKKRKYVTFLAAVPTKADLSDAAYKPGQTYTVAVAGRKGRVRYSSAFETGSPAAFSHNGNLLRLVHSDPEHDEQDYNRSRAIYLRFSKPLDPRTVASGITIEIASQPGRPAIPFSTFLRQTRAGTVELKITPDAYLPASEWIEVTLGMPLADLGGGVIAPAAFSFSTAAN